MAAPSATRSKAGRRRTSRRRSSKSSKFPPPTSTDPNGQRPRTSRGQTIPKLSLLATYSFGDNFSSQDIRVTKTFLFHERYKLNAFAEGLNIFNIANLGGISNSLNNPSSFGILTSRAGQFFGSGGPRASHAGGRFSF